MFVKYASYDGSSKKSLCLVQTNKKEKTFFFLTLQVLIKKPRVEKLVEKKNKSDFLFFFLKKISGFRNDLIKFKSGLQILSLKTRTILKYLSRVCFDSIC